MSAKKKLIAELIRSLTEDWQDWSFDSHTATNKKTGVRLWIANVPILHLSVYYPTPVNFSLIDKIRIYRALSECRSLWVLSLGFNDTSKKP